MIFKKSILAQIISLLICLQMTTFSPVAWAEIAADGGPNTADDAFDADSDKKPAQPGPSAISYLRDCEDLLTVSGNGLFERRFIEGADDEQKMMQLLFDYQIIFTNLSQKSLVLAMSQAMPEFAAHGENANKNVYGEKVDGIKDLVIALAKFAKTPEQVKNVAWTLLDQLVDLSAGFGEDRNAQQIRHLQLTRFRDEIKKSANKEIFERVMSEYVREQLLATVNYKVDRFMRFHLGKSTGGSARGFSIVGAGMLTAILGLNYLTFDLNNFYCTGNPSHCYANWSPIFGAFKLVLSTAIGGAASGFLSIIAADPIVKSYDAKSIRPLKTKILKKYNLRNRLHAYEASSNQIFEAYANAFGGGLVSIEKACKENICNFTPEQIAYVGHIDFLELERLNMAIRDGFREKPIDDYVAMIRKTAQEVLDSPSSYKKQMALRAQVELFVKELSAVRDIRKSVAAEVETKTKALVQAMTKLRDKPYQGKASDLTADDVMKNQLLLAKINTDLAKLDKIPVNTQAFEAKIERAKEAAGRMEKYLGNMPRQPEEWSKLAEDLMLEADRMGQ